MKIHVEDIVAASKEFVAAQIVQYQSAVKDDEPIEVQSLYLHDAVAALNATATIQAFAKPSNLIAHDHVMNALYKMDTAPREYFMEMIDNKIKERGHAIPS